ncbi:MAG: LysM peptidoglycan-binding domain-containing protein [Puniceicoccales bacterium]|jgi:LysM repeat protein|nr:LysM peptidoglycan-binding domain-containing protein [Puniceicoccales bacterium]
MEESQILDSNPESKTNPVVLIISIIAGVLSILALILAIRLNGTVHTLSNADNTGSVNESVRKVVDEEIARLRPALAQSLTAMDSRLEQLHSSINLVKAQAASGSPQASQLTQHVQSLEARIKSLETRRVAVAPVDTQPRPANTGSGARAGNTGGHGNEGTAVAAGGTYTAVAGDNLYLIARKHGVSLKDVEVLNPRLAAKPTLLSVGTKVRIPPKSASAQPAGTSRREPEAGASRAAGGTGTRR